MFRAAAGESNQQIASGLNLPEVTVGKWRRGFVSRGLEGLQDAPRSGRPPKHDAGVRQKVQTLARQQPESQGRWSLGGHFKTGHSWLVQNRPTETLRTDPFYPT